MARRRGLARADVLDAAAEMVDAHGLAGIRLRALADHLGVRAPSLYNYFPSRDGLVDALALRAITELSAALQAAAIGRAGADAVIAIADAYRAYAHEHPGLYATIQQLSRDAPPEIIAAADALTGVVAGSLRQWALGGDDAIHAVRALRSALHGFVEIEALGSFEMPIDVDESFRRLVATLIAGFGAAGAPNAR